MNAPDRSLESNPAAGVQSRRGWFPVWIALWAVLIPCGVRAAESRFVCEAPKSAQLRLSGPLGARIDANVEQWLLRAPASNPGMLTMFALRDRKPPPNLVPWAGEFVGKYLISAIQALRMSGDPDLRELTARVIADLIALQAEDGYLGPFPRDVRLKANWDLWGHYHCMLALLMWHDMTGDQAALGAARRIADLACQTFLDSNFRVFDAGSHEMNMAFIHGLARLYRLAPNPRYLQLLRAIEKDWERSGDYLRTGLANIEFFQTPRPRWESLHDLQGLVELYLITGDSDYRKAFERHWKSILRFDRRNTGGFSSGEQATGNPYASTPIETCCTIAWTAITIDMLKLTGDSRVADELELSLFNAVLGAQHPSGCWWTYNTPMEGVREASAHTIVFQSRAGTPELNCCSVNGPRGLGMLSEWAVMNTSDGLAINFYGPGNYQGKLPDNTPIGLEWETDYPVSGRIKIRVEPAAPRRFNLKLRIPAWVRSADVRLNGTGIRNVVSGRYLELNRRWTESDRIEIEFDPELRVVAGDREAAGRVSIYRGPLLLAYDQAWNAAEYDAVPPLDLRRLGEQREVFTRENDVKDPLVPWLMIDVPAVDGSTVRLVDFASAGLKGTRYRSWLPASNPPPPRVVTAIPADGAAISPGGAVFSWIGPEQAGESVREYELLISANERFDKPLIRVGGIRANRHRLDEADLKQLSPGRLYFWKVIASNAHGTAESVPPASVFRIGALPGG